MDRITVPLTEFKLASDDDKTEVGSFTGLGAAFGNVDSYGDVIVPGAFTKYLERVAAGKAQPPMMLLQHGMGFGVEDALPIGEWHEFAETSAGLKMKGQVILEHEAGGIKVPSQIGVRVYDLMKRKQITGLSIGYITRKAESPAPGAPKGAIRMLTEVDLSEVSVVTKPANTRARVSSVKAAAMTEREIERLLMRDAGLSRSAAQALMRGGINALKATRDAGDEGEPNGNAGMDLLAALRMPPDPAYLLSNWN